MTKLELLKRVQSDIELMFPGTQFDVRHLFGATLWSSYPKGDRDGISTLFAELANSELKDKVKILEANQNLSIQKYSKIGEKAIKKPTDVFPSEPVTVNRGSRGNA